MRFEENSRKNGGEKTWNFNSFSDSSSDSRINYFNGRFMQLNCCLLCVCVYIWADAPSRFVCTIKSIRSYLVLRMFLLFFPMSQKRATLNVTTRNENNDKRIRINRHKVKCMLLSNWIRLFNISETRFQILNWFHYGAQ